MGGKSKIEWCDATWNPVQGCTPISAGCKNCYAKRIAERFKGTKGHPYEYGFNVLFFPERLSIPSKWKKPKNIFVCSMGDLFHERVSDGVLYKVFAEMFANSHHVFFVLTKRPERMAEFIAGIREVLPGSHSLDHIWFGVSVENNVSIQRMDTLAGIANINRFVSFEPLLEVLDPYLLDSLLEMHWIIVGAETGPKARVMPRTAAVDLLVDRTCRMTPYFFKKWSKGYEPRNPEMPREFPEFRKDVEIEG